MSNGSKPQLQIIIASTRPGRVGLPVGKWFEQCAIDHGAFEVEVADLAEIDLPFLDEPNHPSQQRYTKQHTLDWSARIASSDAFVFVMPEYNHSYTAPLKNAIDYLVKEWGFKPIGLVSYGGISGGIRAVQALKPVLMGLQMFVLKEAVVIQFVASLIEDDGTFQPTAAIANSVKPMLDELARVNPVLKQLRK
ncbi:MAG TPA: NAD(P)H-dependent oxidoreductase [Thermomicrobiales bacterium]|nr:NAD(P)H-dependent oxidoreductase [Thermomicrobiales bacterium]